MHSCGSFVGQARLQFAGLHSLFLALWCTVIEIGGAMTKFTFLVSDVSISWVYLLVQMPLWQLLYLHWLNVRCCRCSFCNCCICTALIFIVADTFLETDVSATYFSLNLQILFSLPVVYNCIYILPFLKLADASFANFSSSIPENSLSQMPSSHPYPLSSIYFTT